MSNFPAQAALAGNPTQGEFKTAIAAFLDATRQLPGARANTEPLTIASGAITPTKGFHTINTEGSAAADDLEVIDQTNLPDGSFLYLLQALDARTVTLKHGAGVDGEIVLPGGANITLTNAFDGVILRRRANQWVFVSRLSNLPSTVTPHGMLCFLDQSTDIAPGNEYEWNVPGGVDEIFVTMSGGGGGGGGGGDSFESVDGSDGVMGERTTLQWEGGVGVIDALGGLPGRGGFANGTIPYAEPGAAAPDGPMGKHPPRVYIAGRGGFGGHSGNGTGTGSGGSSGQNGELVIGLRLEVPTANAKLIIHLGAGGEGGLGGHPYAGYNGSDGKPGAVLIQY